ncbi:MAG: hypothetical protein ACLU5J_12720 [Christensenellales bacterium]
MNPILFLVLIIQLEILIILSILSGSSNTILLISNGIILSGTANTLTGLTESELSYQTIVNGDHNTIEQSEYSIVFIWFF